MSNGYHAQLNRLEAQIRELTTERDELRAELAECQGELAALQVKREPLNDEDIIRCGHKAGFYIDAVENEDTEEFIEGFINEDGEVDNESFIAFARAIEAAHGITGSEK